jgi:PTH1 family peptidyl-tRNA hydrolase
MQRVVSDPWVVVGLGNPGSRYETTRHNIGFVVVDELTRSMAGVAAWRSEFKGQWASGNLKSSDVGQIPLKLLKPQTFMNLSGESVVALLTFFKIPPSRLIVVHDELDIPFGAVRVKHGGGSGGHNGLKSISQALSTQDYFRIRIGIGKPQANIGEQGMAQSQDVSSYVLSPFSREQQGKLPELVARGVEGVETLMIRGLEAAQRLVHAKGEF